MKQFAVRQKMPLTDRIASFVLEPVEGTPIPQWSAGAHVDVDLGEIGTRSYSLIEWPDEDRSVLRIAVQHELDGEGGSKAMHALEVGTRIPVSEPENSFALSTGKEPVILLAGGIGVTPFISMATRLQENEHPFSFHYTCRNSNVIAYRSQLEQSFGPRLNLYFDDEAPIDLESLIEGANDHRFYICGPKGMIETARTIAEKHGVPADRIHVELFTSQKSGGDDKSFEVEVSSTGEIFTVPSGKSIIEVLEENGMDLMYDCQRGDCGICQTEVLAGVPDHRDVVLSEAEKSSGKVMQICVSRALSDRIVLEL